MFATSILLPCAAEKSREIRPRTAEFCPPCAGNQPSFANAPTGRQPREVPLTVTANGYRNSEFGFVGWGNACAPASRGVRRSSSPIYVPPAGILKPVRQPQCERIPISPSLISPLGSTDCDPLVPTHGRPALDLQASCKPCQGGHSQLATVKAVGGRFHGQRRPRRRRAAEQRPGDWRASMARKLPSGRESPMRVNAHKWSGRMAGSTRSAGRDRRRPRVPIMRPMIRPIVRPAGGKAA